MQAAKKAKESTETDVAEANRLIEDQDAKVEALEQQIAALREELSGAKLDHRRLEEAKAKEITALTVENTRLGEHVKTAQEQSKAAEKALETAVTERERDRERPARGTGQGGGDPGQGDEGAVRRPAAATRRGGHAGGKSPHDAQESPGPEAGGIVREISQLCRLSAVSDIVIPAPAQAGANRSEKDGRMIEGAHDRPPPPLAQTGFAESFP